jgi:hypothetical protein
VRQDFFWRACLPLLVISQSLLERKINLCAIIINANEGDWKGITRHLHCKRNKNNSNHQQQQHWHAKVLSFAYINIHTCVFVIIWETVKWHRWRFISKHLFNNSWTPKYKNKRACVCVCKRRRIKLYLWTFDVW